MNYIDTKIMFLHNYLSRVFLFSFFKCRKKNIIVVMKRLHSEKIRFQKSNTQIINCCILTMYCYQSCLCKYLI